MTFTIRPLGAPTAESSPENISGSGVAEASGNSRKRVARLVADAERFVIRPVKTSADVGRAVRSFARRASGVIEDADRLFVQRVHPAPGETVAVLRQTKRRTSGLLETLNLGPHEDGFSAHDGGALWARDGNRWTIVSGGKEPPTIVDFGKDVQLERFEAGQAVFYRDGRRFAVDETGEAAEVRWAA